MNIVVNLLVTAIGILHIYIFVLETFLWTKPKGLKVFGTTLEQAKSSAVLAANQGVYNLFLAAALFWSLLVSNAEVAFQFKAFTLTCVLIAGITGGLTSNKRILFIQASPAFITLVLLLSN